MDPTILTNTYVLAGIVLWELVWKGIALWKSARLSQRNWFVAILIFNTIGILPIAYICFFSKKKEETKATVQKKEAPGKNKGKKK